MPDDNKKAITIKNTEENSLVANIDQLSPETREALAKLVVEKKIETEAQMANDALKTQNANNDFDRHIAAVNSFSYGNRRGVDHVQTNIDTPAGHMKLDSHSSRCYVATATYENINHPNVIILRDYRDRYLRKSFFGRGFIIAYYSVGKYLAFFPKHFKLIRELSKKAIGKFVEHIIIKYYL